jgi:hypothetical protein
MSNESGWHKPHRLKQRRYLEIGYGVAGERLSVWVDDDGWCHELHPGHPTRFHAFRDDAGKFWAIRCPLSLTQDRDDDGSLVQGEKGRVRTA